MLIRKSGQDLRNLNRGDVIMWDGRYALVTSDRRADENPMLVYLDSGETFYAPIKSVAVVFPKALLLPYGVAEVQKS